MTKHWKIYAIAGGVLLITIGGVWWGYAAQFRAPDSRGQEKEVFVVSRTASPADIQAKLKDRDLYRNQWAFERVLARHGGYEAIEEGGYDVSKAMDATTLADTLTRPPSRVWVTIPEGWRKEQIAERLAAALDWTAEEESAFVTMYTAMTFEKKEGYSFPDTYLLPRDEDGLAIANRMLARFEEAFFPYYEKFLNANIKHDTAVKLASIIQREAAGPADRRLIAGILWNRLEKGMRLEIDATVQYVVGSKERGWWPVITKEDIAVDSPYNTYRVNGLPPHPIANPGIAAIDAVLNAEETDCLYYLHDADGVIHCSVTFEEHKQNIETYLRKE